MGRGAIGSRVYRRREEGVGRRFVHKGTSEGCAYYACAVLDAVLTIAIIFLVSADRLHPQVRGPPEHLSQRRRPFEIDAEHRSRFRPSLR